MAWMMTYACFAYTSAMNAVSKMCRKGKETIYSFREFAITKRDSIREFVVKK